ncbi:ATP synthase subunit C lysine N-methyltransferase isoform X2 [Cylas formicarius]|uniref:ATP synthase subunit C lysine N-methyltransferase isoform X2 n=1 Tax=Cylas formicarius TaxID=197179 RepID=UPI0029586C99|nr:ATP synthase subunit C lysine N-methyltransferase isoform X2 [Cylas formicarius]
MAALDTLLSETTSAKPVKISPAGKILVGITVGLTVICAPFISPAFRKICLPYIPATSEQLKNIVVALRGKKGTLLDLGSGDGRIVLEAAKHNFVSHGIELNPWLVLYSKFSAFKTGHHQAKFYRNDLWKFDLSNYDNIVVFGVEQMMHKLEKKFIKECKTNCNVLACRFPLPNLVPIETIGHGIDRVWVYNIKPS